MSRSLADNYLAPTPPPADAVNLHCPDLRRHPPRSPRVRLGGYVQLPRLIDKVRALAVARGGDYAFPCPFDQRLLDFTGLSAAALQAAIVAASDDTGVLDFIRRAGLPHRAEEIAAWSAGMAEREPDSPASRQFFNAVLARIAPHRDDIVTWFDWLDLDDFVSFRGVP